jgi:hypothetical protein
MRQHLSAWYRCGLLLALGSVACSGSDAVPASTTASTSATGGGGSGGATTSHSGGLGGEHSSGGGAGIGGGAGAGGGDAGVPQLCPDLAIAPSCFGRQVVYREWSASVAGDGVYFAGQEPWRLGFDRQHGMLWLVKIRLDDESYYGRIAAYGDSAGGIAWLSDEPCDASFAVTSSLYEWNLQGGGTLEFVSVKDAADAAKLDSDPALAQYKSLPRLRAGGCYYAMFENTSGLPPMPMTSSWVETTEDACGGGPGDSCYYLAFEFNHLLYAPGTTDVFQNAVIPGLTTP